jgi:hypothetical protein
LLASHPANASQPPIKIGPVQESYPYPRRRVSLRNGGQKVPGFDVFQGEFQLCASAWHELAGRWGIKLNWSQLDGNEIFLFLTQFLDFFL